MRERRLIRPACCQLSRVTCDSRKPCAYSKTSMQMRDKPAVTMMLLAELVTSGYYLNCSSLRLQK